MRKMDIRMLGCIIYITNIAGILIYMFAFHKLTPGLTLIFAFSAAALFHLYRNEVKWLWKKIFGDDDFRGGSFT